MFDIEARPAELLDLRGQLHDIAEPCRGEETGAGVDQWNADDAEGADQVVSGHAQRDLEQPPSPPVEEFEEAAIEDGAGRIAMTPFDLRAFVTA